MSTISPNCLNPLKSGPAFGRMATPQWWNISWESQSPQIGACLRTKVHYRGKVRAGLVSIPSNRGLPSDKRKPVWQRISSGGLNPLKSGPAFGLQAAKLVRGDQHLSQSPQIGACLRTCALPQRQVAALRVSIPSNRGLPSDFCPAGSCVPAGTRLNPLKSGPAFGRQPITGTLKASASVSIPSNRGLPSDPFNQPRWATGGTSLNPLKSGPAFGPQVPAGQDERSQRCLNPLKSGPAFGPRHQGAYALPPSKVSIPSNRGLPSDIKWKSRLPCLMLSLNPLKSGPAFGRPSRLRCIVDAAAVSIPSNRGLPSDASITDVFFDCTSGLNPLKSGPAFGPLPSAISLRLEDGVSIPSNRGLPSD